ncbi:MAG: hypothetical protein JO206_09810 [Solirubrobacterales bacterium]|nr:hypothetical protein [Solirubrobacterales bacterium]MBV9473252.1 hypothetical protein [Solirubrobacterales bacterium]MBV9837192.1 hypothetical protein [Solirubrobacterales bacterium]
MSDSPSTPSPPPAPRLPDVDSPPAADVLAGVPSKEELIDNTESAEQVVEQQPSVEELLGPER